MRLLHALLREACARHPENTAFLGHSATSYAELDRQTGGFAAALHELGLRRGDRVAIVLDGDADYLVAFYGSLKAGGVAVPLCPDTKTKPLVHALSDSEARVVVLDAANLRYLEGQAGVLPGLSAVIVRGAGRLSAPGHWTQATFEGLVAAGRERHDSGVGEDELAAIIYTSGTTAQPKGVMLPHRALVANTLSIVDYLALGPSEIAGMVLPFYYVFGNSVLHTHLAVGATIAALGSMAFLGQVLRNLADRRCTSLSAVPSTFARLSGVSDLSSFDLSRLRYVAQAGAAMSPTQIRKLRAALPNVAIVLMYGQTEASARLAYVPPDMLERKLGSAGRAIPGVALRVLDAQGCELPRGEVGEIVAQGENVMLGYWKDPEATARVLRPEGLRTGDLGYMDEDGYLFLEGRASELIKSGGHRISPTEIEEAIATAPGIHDCGVVGVFDDLLGEAIVGFIVPAPEARLTKRTVLDACFAALPRFKMPSTLWLVEALPRNTAGKLQRHVLRQWFTEGRGAELA